ncbi:hypothetical protein MRB53_023044 [Persea americana]|uniref:Uncharacterized protein n=1 Tax=Persea americana TaxID=3435 RepID=A0ACC2L950_PERAE|nr:hypothetical protein MRB53_023044 [Persea americana]
MSGAHLFAHFFVFPLVSKLKEGKTPNRWQFARSRPSIAGILISSLDPSPQLTSRDATTSDCPSPNSLFLFTMSRSRHGLPPLPNPFSALPSVEPPLPNPPL